MSGPQYSGRDGSKSYDHEYYNRDQRHLKCESTICNYGPRNERLCPTMAKMAAPREKASQNKGDKMAAPTQLRRETIKVQLKPNWGEFARNFSSQGF